MAIITLKVDYLYWILLVDLGEVTVGRYIGKGYFQIIGSDKILDGSHLFVLSEIEIENRVSGNSYVIGSE